MKSREHNLLIPIIFLLFIFLFPSFTVKSNPIPLKNNFSGKFNVESNDYQLADLYTDAVEEEELNKEEVIEKDKGKVDLVDLVLNYSNQIAIKNKSFITEDVDELIYSESGKQIILKIKKWLI